MEIVTGSGLKVDLEVGSKYIVTSSKTQESWEVELIKISPAGEEITLEEMWEYTKPFRRNLPYLVWRYKKPNVFVFKPLSDNAGKLCCAILTEKYLTSNKSVNTIQKI